MTGHLRILTLLCTVILDSEVALAETVKVGVPIPLSGIRADGGQYGKNGLQMALEEINRDSSRKFKLEFLYEDTQYNPRLAVTAFHKLKNIQNVKYIIGLFGSSEVLAVAPLAEQSKTLLITPSAQSDEISSAGDYIFRLNHNSAQEAPFFADFVSKKMRGTRLHFLVIQTAFSPSYLKNFLPTLAARGKQAGETLEFDPAVTDLRPQLLRIQARQPSDIMLLATPTHIGLALKQAAEMGIAAQFYSIASEGPEIVRQAGSAAEGLLYPYSYDSQAQASRVKTFVQKYSERFGEIPDYTAPNSYDAAYILSECLEKVGDDADAVKNCLYGLGEYPGASGTFSFDKNGDAERKLLIKTVHNGKHVNYR